MQSVEAGPHCAEKMGLRIFTVLWWAVEALLASVRHHLTPEVTKRP